MKRTQLQCWLDRMIALFPARLALFALIAPAAVWYGFLANSAAESGELLKRFGYFTMLGTFAWWLLRLIASAREEPGVSRAFSWSSMLRNRAAWVAILGLTVVAWCTFPYTYKVLYDELVLQSTALNLHFFREQGTLVRGYEVEGVFSSLDVYLDKRPLFYPFVVSLVHDLTGYRTSNGFWVNTFLMPVVLGMIYLIARRMTGRRTGVVAVVCFGASSLLAQNANGTGMEMLNLAMFVITLGAAVYYLEKPEERRLSVLVLSCVLLAQTRYESSAYVVCAGVVILEGWRRAGRVILSPAALCAPLLLVPCALHNTYLAGTPVLWELREDVSSRFGLQYFWANLGHAGYYFFGLSSRFLNIWWLSVAGFAATGWGLVNLFKERKTWRDSSPATVGIVIMGAGVVGNLGLLLAYFWGQLDDPIVSRLALPFYAILALSVAWAVSRLPSDWQNRACTWLVAGALLSYLTLGLKDTAYNVTVNQRATEIAWEESWLDSQAQVPRLIISNKTGLNWIVRKTPSISMRLARTRANEIKFHMDAGTFYEVLVSQYYRPIGPKGGFILDPEDALPKSYLLEPVMERQIGAKLLRISRVVEIVLDLPDKAVSTGENKAQSLTTR